LTVKTVPSLVSLCSITQDDGKYIVGCDPLPLSYLAGAGVPYGTCSIILSHPEGSIHGKLGKNLQNDCHARGRFGGRRPGIFELPAIMEDDLFFSIILCLDIIISFDIMN
jgi:hypothetical protein